ncbi:MAG: suppressor of fused domain protein [Thermoanaerobaculia bacterium]
MSLRDFVTRLISRFKPAAAAQAHDGDDGAPGWQAIDAALKPLYGDQEPQHWGTIVSWRLGGPDPLDGISAYRVDGAIPHWHYVSYGMTDLYAKESDDPEHSGWGFEFTFRLKREDEEKPPVWPASLLQNLSRYVFDSGAAFNHGHHIDCNGPIAADVQTDLSALLFISDPQLMPIQTPHGKVVFLQAVGITGDELAASRAWNSESFAAILQRTDPLLVTDIHRASVLSDTAIAREISEGQSRESSSSVALHVETLTVERENGRWVIGLTEAVAAVLPGYIRGRLLHHHDFTIIGVDLAIVLQPAPVDGISGNDQILTISLTPATAAAMAESIHARPGRYDVAALGVTFNVAPAVPRP